MPLPAQATAKPLIANGESLRNKTIFLRKM